MIPCDASRLVIWTKPDFLAWSVVVTAALGGPGFKCRPAIVPAGRGLPLLNQFPARGSAPRFLNSAAVVEPDVEHGEQAEQSHGEPVARSDRQVVRNAGQ